MWVRFPHGLLMKHPPLESANDPLLQDSWRWKWMVLPSWNRLHRISSIEWGIDQNGNRQWSEDERVGGFGVAVCGATGYFDLPGIFSRMGLERCAHCCDALGISRDDGAPFNQGIDV